MQCDFFTILVYVFIDSSTVSCTCITFFSQTYIIVLNIRLWSLLLLLQLVLLIEMFHPPDLFWPNSQETVGSFQYSDLHAISNTHASSAWRAFAHCKMTILALKEDVLLSVVIWHLDIHIIVFGLMWNGPNLTQRHGFSRVLLSKTYTN